MGCPAIAAHYDRGLLPRSASTSAAGRWPGRRSTMTIAMRGGMVTAHNAVIRALTVMTAPPAHRARRVLSSGQAPLQPPGNPFGPHRQDHH
jgi:hypothetical protein